jgi:hypothetical protein
MEPRVTPILYSSPSVSRYTYAISVYIIVFLFILCGRDRSLPDNRLEFEWNGSILAFAGAGIISLRLPTVPRQDDELVG